MTKIENMHRQKVDKSRVLSKKGKLGLQNTPLLNHQREFVAPPKRSLVFQEKTIFLPSPEVSSTSRWRSLLSELPPLPWLFWPSFVFKAFFVDFPLSLLSRSLGNQDSYCFHFKIESHPQSKRARKKRREAAQLRGFFLSLALIYLKAMTELKDFYQWP